MTHDINWRAVMVRSLIQRDGRDCYLCNCPMEFMSEITIDHILPRSLGGEDTFENFRLAHEHCNQIRGNKNAIEPHEIIAEKARWKINAIQKSRK